MQLKKSQGNRKSMFWGGINYLVYLTAYCQLFAMSEKIAQGIVEMLKKEGMEFEVFDHEPVYTSVQAALIREVELSTGVKSLIFRGMKTGNYICVLVRADKKADLGKIEKMEGERLRMGTPEEVLEITDCEVGSVPPFGHKTKLKTYFDKRMLEEKESNFNIGLVTCSVKMSPSDLHKIVRGIDY